MVADLRQYLQKKTIVELTALAATVWAWQARKDKRPGYAETDGKPPAYLKLDKKKDLLEYLCRAGRSSITFATDGKERSLFEQKQLNEHDPRTIRKEKRTKFLAGKEQRIRILTDGNPKRTGSMAHARFAQYQNGITVGALMRKGHKLSNINWDVKHGNIALEEPKNVPKG